VVAQLAAPQEGLSSVTILLLLLLLLLLLFGILAITFAHKQIRI
jgi:hypothetical protein